MKFTGKSHKLAKLQKLSRVDAFFGDIIAAKINDIWFDCDYKINRANKINAVKCSRHPLTNIHTIAKLEAARDKLTDPTFNRA